LPAEKQARRSAHIMLRMGLLLRGVDSLKLHFDSRRTNTGREDRTGSIGDC